MALITVLIILVVAVRPLVRSGIFYSTPKIACKDSKQTIKLTIIIVFQIHHSCHFTVPLKLSYTHYTTSTLKCQREICSIDVKNIIKNSISCDSSADRRLRRAAPCGRSPREGLPAAGQPFLPDKKRDRLLSSPFWILDIFALMTKRARGIPSQLCRPDEVPA